MKPVNIHEIEALESTLADIDNGVISASDIQSTCSKLIDQIIALDLGSFAGSSSGSKAMARDVRGANILLSLARKKPHLVTSESVRRLVEKIGKTNDPIDTLLTRAVSSGAKIAHKNIHKSPLRILSTGGQLLPGTGRGKKERIGAAKFDSVVSILLRAGIAYDPEIMEESLSQNDLREFPYRSIRLPGLQKTLCVSDEVGQATYVFDGILDMSALSQTRKSQGVQIIWSANAHAYEKALLLGLKTKKLEGEKPEEIDEMDTWGREVLHASVETLKPIGILFDPDTGIWDLTRALGNRFWPKIGGVRLGSFPSGPWLAKNNIGKKNGTSNTIHSVGELGQVFEKLGEKVKVLNDGEVDLKYNVPKDPELVDAYDDSYRQKSRACLEANAAVLAAAGAQFRSPNTWDITKMCGNPDWPKIGGKGLNHFPSRGWCLKFLRQESLNSVLDFGCMLALLDYEVTAADSNPMKYSFWGEESERAEYDERYIQSAVAMLKGQRNLEALKASGIIFDPELDEWDISDARGNNKWPMINKKNLKYFPDVEWNRRNGTMGTEGKGRLSNRDDIRKMLVSLGQKVK